MSNSGLNTVKCRCWVFCMEITTSCPFSFSFVLFFSIWEFELDWKLSYPSWFSEEEHRPLVACSFAGVEIVSGRTGWLFFIWTQPSSCWGVACSLLHCVPCDFTWFLRGCSFWHLLLASLGSVSHRPATWRWEGAGAEGKERGLPQLPRARRPASQSPEGCRTRTEGGPMGKGGGAASMPAGEGHPRIVLPRTSKPAPPPPTKGKTSLRWS